MTQDTAAAAPLSLPKKITKAWLDDLSINHLVSVLTQARDAYYNTGSGQLPLMSDTLFDYGEDLLKSANPKHAYFKRVGHAIPSKNKKVRLSIPMGSLGKVRTPEEIAAFLQGETQVDISDKLDGLSLQIEEKANRLGAYTRGNGTVGQDVTHLLPHINHIGKPIKGWTIRGEAVIPTKRFKGKVAQEFKNPRNLASGIVNSKGVSDNARLLDFVVHGVQRPANISLKAATARLKQAGWKVAFNTTLKGNIAQQLPVFLAARHAASKYEIDGVVLTTKNGIIAFKGKDNQAGAEVSHVEWNASRHGMLNPVAVFKKPVLLDGVEVKRATAYNAKFIVDMGIGPGALVEVVRSGKVIPKIERVIKKVKPQLPEGTNWQWNDTKVDIVLKKGQEGEHNSLIKTWRVTHFVSKLGMEGVKGGLLWRMVEAGYDTPKKLMKATTAQMLKAGLGPKQAELLRKNLDTFVPKASLTAMMDASGFWPRGWAESRFETLIDNVSYHVLVTHMKDKAKITELISGVKSLGSKTAEGFGPALVKFEKFIKDIGYTVVVPKTGAKVKRGPLHGQRFCFTNFRDPHLEKMIKDKGGAIASGVSRTTHYLVVPDKNTTSGKVTAAKNNGVTKTITIQELQKMLK